MCLLNILITIFKIFWSIKILLLLSVAIHASLPRFLGFAFCPWVTINSTHFHSQGTSALDNKLFGQPNFK